MDPEPKTQHWSICPVCHKASAAGTDYCKHCWGASLRSAEIVTTEQLAETVDRWQDRLKHRRQMKLAAVILIPLIVIAAVTLFILNAYTDVLSKPPLTLNSGSRLDEWAMFRHDLQHSGVTGSSDILPHGEVAWTFPTGGAIQSSPAVVNGTVYFGSRDGALYAVDTVTGTKRWEYHTGSRVESSPAVIDGTVYFGSNDGKLYALKADSGARLWSFNASYPVISSPAVAGGRVYFGSDSYSFYSLDAATGKKLWEFKTKGPVQSSPVIAKGIVYFGSGTDYLYALHALNGRLRLHFKALDSVFSSPVMNDEKVYFGTASGFLYAIQGNARNWPWEHFIRPLWMQLWAMGWAPEPSPQSGSIWGIKLGKEVDSSPVMVDSTLYVGADNNLTAIDLQNGKVLWTFNTEGLIRSSPAAAGNTVYVGSNDGRLYAVDALSGKKLWEVLTGGKIGSSPALVDGTIYVGSDDGNLYAIK